MLEHLRQQNAVALDEKFLHCECNVDQSSQRFGIGFSAAADHIEAS